MQLFLGILLLVMAIFLVISVLMQSGKSKRLSGSIAGGAETFFGKSKGRTIDAVLSKITTIVAIVFVLVVIIVYIAFGTNYTEPEIIYNYDDIIENVENDATESDATTEPVEGEIAPEATEGTDVAEETTEISEEADVAEVTEEPTEAPTEE